MSSQQQYCLRWNNHSANFITVFEELFRTESFTNVTIGLRTGTSIRCHKLVLAACSTYFQEVLSFYPEEAALVFLIDVEDVIIRAILEYMYKGEVNISQEHLGNLLRVASYLKVKGLVEDPELNSRKDDVEPSMSPPPAVSTSTTSSMAHSSGYVSPPQNTSPIFIPYGKSPVEKNHHNDVPLWSAFPGIPMPQHPISGHQPPPRSQQQSNLGGSYENSSESSPLRRKKLSSLMANRDTPILRNVLGQGQADSSQGLLLSTVQKDRQESSFCSNSNGSANDSDRRNSADFSEPAIDYEEKSPRTPTYPSVTKTGAKPEWKRYKQYTREHINEAMTAVRNKEMSALQAARKYGVPSRTLYDKLKKAGILPSRGAGIQRRDSHCDSARFPYSPSINGSVYGNNSTGNVLSESESETNGISPAIETQYNVRDTGIVIKNHDMTDTGVMDMSTRSPSPVSVHNNRNNSSIEDEVEDLSMSRHANSSAIADMRVIVPPVVTVKQEEQMDTDTPQRI